MQLTEEQIRAIAAKHVSPCSDQVRCALVEDVQNAIRAALAAHNAGAQEPVAWMYQSEDRPRRR